MFNLSHLNHSLKYLKCNPPWLEISPTRARVSRKPQLLPWHRFDFHTIKMIVYQLLNPITPRIENHRIPGLLAMNLPASPIPARG
jgi:hypothetical protein